MKRGIQTLLIFNAADSFIQFTLPSAEVITLSQLSQLTFSIKLSKVSKDAIIFSKLESSSLISLGRLYDDGCDVLLNKNNLKVIKDSDFMLEGKRNYSYRLWDMPMCSLLY